MEKLFFSNKLLAGRLVMLVAVSIALLFIFVVLVALLRTACHLSTLIIFALVLLVANMLLLSSRKNSYFLSGENLHVSEYFGWFKSVELVIPLSHISSCQTKGFGPWKTIHLLIDDEVYVLHCPNCAEELTQSINIKIK